MTTQLTPFQQAIRKEVIAMRDDGLLDTRTLSVVSNFMGLEGPFSAPSETPPKREKRVSQHVDGNGNDGWELPITLGVDARELAKILPEAESELTASRLLVQLSMLTGNEWYERFADNYLYRDQGAKQRLTRLLTDSGWERLLTPNGSHRHEKGQPMYRPAKTPQPEKSTHNDT